MRTLQSALIPVLLVSLCYLLRSVLLIQSISKNPSVLIEGCLDDGCLQSLTQNFKQISKCFDTLREHIPPDTEDYSLKLCCNVVQYERCLFPFIISYCGMDSLDKFESELRSLNSMCSLTTLQWNKCEANKTLPENNELELRE